MECPHCNQPLPEDGEEQKLLTCESCGQKLLPGAAFCHMCGRQLSEGGQEEPKLLTCESCGHESPATHNYCPECGAQLKGDLKEDEDLVGGFDPDKRVACADGLCIGILGPDGKCTVCGRSHAQVQAEEESASQEPAEVEAAAEEPVEEESVEEEPAAEKEAKE